MVRRDMAWTPPLENTLQIETTYAGSGVSSNWKPELQSVWMVSALASVGGLAQVVAGVSSTLCRRLMVLGRSTPDTSTNFGCCLVTAGVGRHNRDLKVTVTVLSTQTTAHDFHVGAPAASAC
ncbi:hypothetical protein PR202_ga18153 [Eleusine coracana subsp. coracana]|uniref:Uncharacterized protein n=1 Tax=Eleusine coracana subsp. coracana TaxID=191504 RepID=A0AAV5CRQ8_ELECO|nr:hypothetical protein PR202_ga18153 [Eleusine coracana subsp. coracana]